VYKCSGIVNIELIL